MNAVWSKIAAVLAFIIGAMAIVSGGKVLLGNDPGYYVIAWLPVYNFTLGAISALLTAVLIWKNHRFALPAALATLGMHTLVMTILQTGFRDVVAAESLKAMTLRMSVWLVVSALLFVQSRKNKTAKLEQNQAVS